jgi:hypothetical protein
VLSFREIHMEVVKIARRDDMIAGRVRCGE